MINIISNAINGIWESLGLEILNEECLLTEHSFSDFLVGNFATSEALRYLAQLGLLLVVILGLAALFVWAFKFIFKLVRLD